VRALGKGSASQQKPPLGLFSHHFDSRLGVTRMMTVVANVELAKIRAQSKTIRAQSKRDIKAAVSQIAIAAPFRGDSAIVATEGDIHVAIFREGWQVDEIGHDEHP
jgi:hypothetical protein